MKEFSTVHAQTQAVYEAQASHWDAHRSRSLREQPWLDKFIAAIQPQGKILDVGCGGGDPIARYFIEHQFSLTGIDAANAMIDIARSRFPSTRWMQMDMRELNLDTRFDGIVSWDSFFHLNPEEQHCTLNYFVEHIKPDGALLLTVGHQAGEVLGQVGGQAVYHSSLAPTEYQDILCKAGFTTVEYVAQDQQCDRSVLLAYHRSV